ncbi:MAG: transposase [Planctomycetes bacterium]|nr:transposase [Planctomycetota bacterium]
MRQSLCGYMLTWTTYGAWLHGDERGAYNRKGETLREHYVAPDPRLEQLNRNRMKDDALTLDAAMRKVVRLAIEECCAFRGWPLRALNVRTNHVHVVIPPDAPGDDMIHDLKARATRKLREAGLVARGQHVWTRGGSTSRLYGSKSLADAIEYVTHGQGPALPEA